MSTLRTFIGYYHVTAAGIRGVITRPAITVPKTPAQGPSSTLFTAAQIDAAVVSILENNELFPILELNTLFSTGNIEAVFNGVISDANTNNTRNAVKIGFVVPDSGPNAGYPCVSITQKLANSKTTTILPVVDVPVPEEPGAPGEEDYTGPGIFTEPMFDIDGTTDNNLIVTLNGLPDPGLDGADNEILAVYAKVYPDEQTENTTQTFTLPGIDLATPYSFVLDSQYFTNGLTYYVALEGENNWDFSPPGPRKAFVAQLV